MASGEEENELIYISFKEFAQIVQDRNCLGRFSARKIGKHTVNKFEFVISEVIGFKYDEVNVDFINCSSAERNKLRSAFTRIELQIGKNRKRGNPYSVGLADDKPFISSEQYKTLFVFPPKPSKR